MPATLPSRYFGQAYLRSPLGNRAASDESTVGLRPEAAGPRAQSPVGACQAPARRIQLLLVVSKITSIQAINVVHSYISLSLILCYTAHTPYSVRFLLSLLFAPLYTTLGSFLLSSKPLRHLFFLGSLVASSISASEEREKKKQPNPLDTVAGSHSHPSGTASSAGLPVRHELSHASSFSWAINSRRIQPACAVAEPPCATSVFQRRLRQHRRRGS